MVRTTRRRRRRVGSLGVHKPSGILGLRVQRVGPEHFGIVSIDCAKARSKWMLCDFYGRFLVPPTEVPHSRGHLAIAIMQLREAMAKHALQDLVVAIERTGRYHLPVERAYRAAGFECRIVHPFATKQFRQPADPGDKTDDHDLAAIHRATTNGFGLLEPSWDTLFREVQLLARHRRDLVQKRSALCCQLREHWEATLPGFAALFEDLWESPLGIYVARHFETPQAVERASQNGLTSRLREARQRFQEPTLQRVAAWARTAAAPDPLAAMHHQVAAALDDDRAQKTREIAALEAQLATRLVRTPYLLLLSIPGINVVSAAELAGEMGPISSYANARAITGRAGLFPSRYQSDRVDHPHGPLVRCANRALRGALLGIADNLIKCNPHFRGLAALWDPQQRERCRSRIKVASRFARVAYHLLAGGVVYQHPCCRERSYILEKLLTFHRQHGASPAEILEHLDAAMRQLPQCEYAAEAAALTKAFLTGRTSRRRGPQPIAEIVLEVLAKLGVSQVQSDVTGDPGPGSPDRARGLNNALVPRGENP